MTTHFDDEDRVERSKAPELIPFVWPAVSDAEALGRGDFPAALLELLATMQILVGAVHGLDADGVGFLEHVARSFPSLRCRLLLAVYPACPTRQADLERLHALASASDGLVAFRLALFRADSGLPANVLCLADSAQQVSFVLPPTPNLGLSPPSGMQVGLAFRADPVLLDQWRGWFDCSWGAALDFAPETVEIPELVPAPGSIEAARAWGSYVATCEESREELPEANDEVAPGDGLGGPADSQSGAERQRGISDELGLPRLDEVEVRLSRLYASGAMVTIDKLSRIPPLDAPIKAEWFGIDSFRQVGAVSREVRYRISALDKETLRALENKRKMTRSLLDRFSFSLADGVRWMPNSARRLFEHEMTRVDGEASELLKSVVSGGVDAFIEKQSPKIASDVQKMYQELFPDGQLAEERIQSVLSELGERLTKAFGGSFLPKVSYTPVQYGQADESQWTSRWGAGLQLLSDIARFPRLCFSDHYFLRGVKTELEALLPAMDVCGDTIVKAYEHGPLRNRPKTELGYIDEILEAQSDDRSKCKALFDLIDGRDWDLARKDLLATSIDNKSS